MNSKPALLAAALAASALGGCRSDGGIDRQDGARNLAWAWSRCAERTSADAAQTMAVVKGIPDDVARSFTQGGKNMAETYHLYFENH